MRKISLQWKQGFKVAILLVCTLGFLGVAFGQSGRVAGKVINQKNGEALVGATVTLKSGRTRNATSDLNGRYNFGGLSTGTYTISCSYVGFATKTEEITVKDGELLTLDFVMSEQATSGSDVTVVGRSRRAVAGATVSSLLIAQKNAPSVSDGISAESIRRLPILNSSEALKRVSGASLMNDRFAVIRGMNERYNAAFINGAPLPSSEPDRKAFAFDIFPANMLDNLVVFKTATPDKTADFAGGIIEVTTKSIPPQSFETVSFGLGYNTLATFKTRKYYQGGRMDAFGVDDGTRAIPAGFPSTEVYKFLEPRDRVNYSRMFVNNWATLEGKAIPNLNFQYSLGKNFQKDGKDYFGMLFSVTYNRQFKRFDLDRNSFLQDAGDWLIRNQFVDEAHINETLIGLIANASWKINNNNTIGFKNIYSINSDDELITRSGNPDRTDQPNWFWDARVYWFTSNKIYSSQLIGEHFLPKSKVRVNWVAAYSNIRRDIPNMRRSIYEQFRDRDTIFRHNLASIPLFTNGGAMFWAENKEYGLSTRLDFSRSFKLGKTDHLIKMGGAYNYRDREFTARTLGYAPINRSPIRHSDSMRALPLDRIFDDRNIGYFRGGLTGFIVSETSSPSDNYNGDISSAAGYLMLDQRICKWLRLIYGYRVEQFKQTLQSFRNFTQPVNYLSDITDWLPSANAVFSLDQKQNIRLSYSQTVNRPEFRELAPFLFYNFFTGFNYSGNESLRRALVTNYDFRYEFFPGRAQLFSVSAFYKKFEGPIEQALYDAAGKGITYINAPEATNYGLEAELRMLVGAWLGRSHKSFLNNLTVYGNYTYIWSEVKLTDPNNPFGPLLEANRYLQGQSPYVYNAGLAYQDDKTLWGATLAFNRVGPRLWFIGNFEEPDVWENARSLLDLQISKGFMNNKLEFRLNAKDLLAQRQIYWQDRKANRKYDGKTLDAVIIDQQFARTFSINVTYKLR
jgi:TonB-dependent receptor